MLWLTLLAVFILAGLALCTSMAVSARRSARALAAPRWPFYPRKVMSNRERVPYHRMVKALPDRIVLAQVQLARMLALASGENRHWWLQHIDRNTIDFVICLPDSTVVAAVEVDDDAPSTAHRRRADALKAKALASAGIKLVRWGARQLPNEHTIRAALGGSTADVPTAPMVADPGPMSMLPTVHERVFLPGGPEADFLQRPSRAAQHLRQPVREALGEGSAPSAEEPRRRAGADILALTDARKEERASV